MNKTWYVYLLECNDGSYYTGVTIDVDERIATHKAGKGSKYVAQKGVKKLLRAKPYLTKSDAYKEEYRIKQLPRQQKIFAFD